MHDTRNKTPLLPSTPAHGGALNQAIKNYSNNTSPAEKALWIDLSTGINPDGWPVPEIPAAVYNRLPENDDGLLEAAQSYYQVANILPVSGSQEAIQRLPEIFRQHHLLSDNSQIGIISPCYAEHEFQWKKNHFTIIHLTRHSVDDYLDSLALLVIINPNNPTGELIDTDTIRQWQLKLSTHNGYLIIDEAFMDSTPDNSILKHYPDPAHNLIVLRSVGKFFGLAGIRCGFVIAPEHILSLLKYYQGPWSVSGPTRWIVKQALMDRNWIAENTKTLQKASLKLEELLRHYLLTPSSHGSIAGTVLFKTVLFDNANLISKQLAQNKILVRLLDNKKGLRFGIPANEKQWQRLEKVLKTIAEQLELQTIDKTL